MTYKELVAETMRAIYPDMSDATLQQAQTVGLIVNGPLARQVEQEIPADQVESLRQRMWAAIPGVLTQVVLHKTGVVVNPTLTEAGRVCRQLQAERN